MNKEGFQNPQSSGIKIVRCRKPKSIIRIINSFKLSYPNCVVRQVNIPGLLRIGWLIKSMCSTKDIGLLLTIRCEKLREYNPNVLEYIEEIDRRIVDILYNEKVNT